MVYQPEYTCRQFRLFIIGSRDASPEMLTLAREAVKHAKANGWLILVGDNPRGVDAAVIDACDAMGVNILILGITPRPRKGSQRTGTYWQVDIRHAADGDYSTFAAYAGRDRYAVDLADRVFAIWNGTSRDTLAGYEYAVQQGKPVDLRTFPIATRAKPATQLPTASTAPAPPHTVEIFLDVHETSEYGSFDATYGLRALDGKRTVLYADRGTFNADVHTSDAARMEALIKALERLVSKLKTESAPYRLCICQSSKNVEGWCAKGWKRNALEVQRLAGRIDTLLKHFPDVDWVKMPRAQVEAALTSITSRAKIR